VGIRVKVKTESRKPNLVIVGALLSLLVCFEYIRFDAYSQSFTYT